MSTRKPTTRNRALRPKAENLEDRQLLSAVVSGTDIDGDQWVLQLIGPGSLVVAKQNGADGNPAPLNSQTQIKSITIGGLNPQQSRLVGQVTQGTNGDGKVFFQQLDELPSKSQQLSGGNGPLSIAIPDFWLANTTPSGSTGTPDPVTISIPDGVNTLQFGGVDTTVGQVNPPPSTAQSDVAKVVLGLPQFGGTRIIIDKSISSSQEVPPSGTSTTPTTIQHAVEFDVSGRLNLFQANEILGDAATPPGQFVNQNADATGYGGTWVVSGTSGVAPFLADGRIQGGLTGQIGNVRIGGNATNLSTLVFDATGTGQAKISNFSVGGETTNVLVVAPNGARNLVFGRGMDTVDILAHVVNTLTANRGALNSNVYVDRTISKVTFGGDVVNTNVLSGYVQNFSNIINAVTGQSSVNVFSPTAQPTAPPLPQNAQNAGGMSVLVAGDVTNSVFAASVQPEFVSVNGGTVPRFGTSRNLVLPVGEIVAKVEGTIDNSVSTPDQPTTAFYANKVDLQKGPVIPPNVPEAPYTGKQTYSFVPGFHHPALAVAKGTAARINKHRIGARTPQGPGQF
ncbi:hypothetical protein V5E97_30380 [Singulisphaera sp. Ch08]|uniref:Uncharacterized protein n=1 Tax=Singulisphaera sp. Ch08 TaxID=3120278 RepID=A0AAU7CBV7_9BACT